MRSGLRVQYYIRVHTIEGNYPRCFHVQRGKPSMLAYLVQEARSDSLLALSTHAVAFSGPKPMLTHFGISAQRFFGYSTLKTGRQSTQKSLGRIFSRPKTKKKLREGTSVQKKHMDGGSPGGSLVAATNQHGTFGRLFPFAASSFGLHDRMFA